MAGPLIRIVLEKAKEFLNPDYNLQEDTQKMVEELITTLLRCEETVKEGEKQAIINNRALADLLRMLKGIVYDAEDVLDNRIAKHIEEEVQGKNKVRRSDSSDSLNSLNMVVVQLNKLSTDIPIILSLVNMIENNKSHTHEVTIPKETKTMFTPLQEVGFYGRKSELKQISDIISGSEVKSGQKGTHNLCIIPIVGIGGVGKTALARAVYNDPGVVQQKFESKAWISFSSKLDVDAKLVMCEIYQSLGYSSPDLTTLQNIFTKLTSCIGSVGKFLIVLDGLFEIYDWECLYETLSHCAPGSVVLLTTQNQVFAKSVVANTVDVDPIALRPLDSDIFWELFEHFAFGNEEIPEEKSIILKSIGKKIAAKLHGLPLAANIIGNILRSDINENKWEAISNREWWDIPEGKNIILPSIGLGYKLDPCLWQCFAYCALFPRNSLIEKDRLVHMWMAQNFIQSDDNGVMSLEDIGSQWFDELVEKSFFQRAGDNNSYFMHDLMHDLATIVSSGECFYLGEGVNEIPSGVRHLAIHSRNLDVIKGIRAHKNLRSLLYFGTGEVEGMYSAINNTLSNLDGLRVLDLSNMHMENESTPPPAIWNLQHLRFLDLSTTGMTLSIPSSIVDLYHLQALYIENCKFLEPRNANELRNLRHLCADEQTIDQIYLADPDVLSRPWA